MEYRWSIDGVSMEYRWSIDGVSMEYRWSINNGTEMSENVPESAILGLFYALIIVICDYQRHTVLKQNQKFSDKLSLKYPFYVLWR